MIVYKTKVRLHHTDSAGLLFFANQFTLAHDAYEEFLDQSDLSFQAILTESDFVLPIVHAEADYLDRLLVGDMLTIEMRTEKIGESSFTLSYTIKNQQNKLVGTVRTVHACIDKKKRNKLPLPEEIRSILEKNR